jgi:hypothetical protein
LTPAFSLQGLPAATAAISGGGNTVKKSALVLCLFGLVTTIPLAPAYGQASRTFVSGVGSDTDPCSRTAPCKTFAVAYAATLAGGEINVLDPGGFGSLTINKSISIYNDGAGVAGIVVSGTNAIVINAGVNDVVNLRGLTLNGQGGSLGVHVLAAGSLSIQNCVIQQFGTGVNVATSNNIKVRIQNSTIINNTNGVSFQPGSGTVNAAIEHSHIDSNSGIGVLANGAFGGTTFLGMSDSSASLNALNGVISRSGPGSPGGPGYALVHLIRASVVGNSQFGLLVDGSSGGVAEMVFGNSLITNNVTGAYQTIGNALLWSSGTNEVTYKGPAVPQSFPQK